MKTIIISLLLLSNINRNLTPIYNKPMTINLVSAQATCPGGNVLTCQQLCSEEVWTCKIAKNLLNLDPNTACGPSVCTPYCDLVCRVAK